jgi:hypothetical protein
MNAGTQLGGISPEIRTAVVAGLAGALAAAWRQQYGRTNERPAGSRPADRDDAHEDGRERSESERITVAG